MLKNVVLVFQVICAIGLIASVVMQSGKSAGLSGSIAGGSEAIFGKKKGVDELLARITAYVSVLFMLSTLALALLH